jgi:hypothetical protein
MFFLSYFHSNHSALIPLVRHYPMFFKKDKIVATIFYIFYSFFLKGRSFAGDPAMSITTLLKRLKPHGIF